MIKNKTAEYIDAATGRLLFTEDFVDHELKWVGGPGNWRPHGLFVGYPNARWLRENPKPA